METIDFLNTYADHPELKELIFQEFAKSLSQDYLTVYWFKQTYLAEYLLMYQTQTSADKIIADRNQFKLLGYPILSKMDCVYMVFVSTLVYYVNPSLDLSLSLTKTICSKQFPEETERFINLVQKLSLN